MRESAFAIAQVAFQEETRFQTRISMTPPTPRGFGQEASRRSAKCGRPETQLFVMAELQILGAKSKLNEKRNCISNFYI
jgi:hypothetical protein